MLYLAPEADGRAVVDYSKTIRSDQAVRADASEYMVNGDRIAICELLDKSGIDTLDTAKGMNDRSVKDIAHKLRRLQLNGDAETFIQRIFSSV